MAFITDDLHRRRLLGVRLFEVPGLLWTVQPLILLGKERSDLYGEETPERVAFHKSQAMGNRLTMIEDIAPVVTFLATDGGWITGQTIFVNGGYTTR